MVACSNQARGASLQRIADPVDEAIQPGLDRVAFADRVAFIATGERSQAGRISG
jgi:hypothetical protein